MKTLKLIALSLLALSILSCTKNDDDNDGSTRVKSITYEEIHSEGNYSARIDFEYDGEGRVKKESLYEKNNQGTYVLDGTCEITYETTKITCDHGNNDKAIFNLNADGYVETSTWGSGSETNYTYTNNQLTAINGNSFTWSNGNITEANYESQTTTFTYTDKLYSLSVNLYGYASGGGSLIFKGMVNRNLINTSTYEGDITTYTYTHDGNRLTKIVETDGDDSVTYNIAY